MKFASRLMLCAVVPAAMFVPALATSIGGARLGQARFTSYVETEQATAGGLQEMYAQGLQMGQALRNIVLNPANKKPYDFFHEAQLAYDKALAETRQIPGSSLTAEDLRALTTLRAAHAQSQAAVLSDVKTDGATALRLLTQQETPAWRDLRAKLLEEADSADKAARISYGETQSLVGRVNVLAATLVALAIAVSVATTTLMRRTVQRELGGDPAVAREALRRIADGDLTVDLPTSVSNQGLMGELARTQSQLRHLVDQVRIRSDSIATGSSGIPLALPI